MLVIQGNPTLEKLYHIYISWHIRSTISGLINILQQNQKLLAIAWIQLNKRVKIKLRVAKIIYVPCEICSCTTKLSKQGNVFSVSFFFTTLNFENDFENMT